MLRTMVGTYTPWLCSRKTTSWRNCAGACSTKLPFLKSAWYLVLSLRLPFLLSEAVSRRARCQALPSGGEASSFASHIGAFGVFGAGGLGICTRTPHVTSAARLRACLPRPDRDGTCPAQAATAHAPHRPRRHMSAIACPERTTGTSMRRPLPATCIPLWCWVGKVRDVGPGTRTERRNWFRTLVFLKNDSEILIFRGFKLAG